MFLPPFSIHHERYSYRRKYKPWYFILAENSPVLCFLPVMKINSWLTGCRWVSLPFSGYAGPIFSETINRDIVLNHILDNKKERGIPSHDFKR
jgi:hypothetical protein